MEVKQLSTVFRSQLRMGCGGSSLVEIYPEEWITSFESLQLTRRDLVRLERVFGKIDESGDMKVDIQELLDYLDIAHTPFTTKVFSIFDEDSSGHIDFREFVLSLWNFCSCTDASLAMFAFDLVRVLSFINHSSII